MLIGLGAWLLTMGVWLGKWAGCTGRPKTCGYHWGVSLGGCGAGSNAGLGGARTLGKLIVGRKGCGCTSPAGMGGWPSPDGKGGGTGGMARGVVVGLSLLMV